MPYHEGIEKKKKIEFFEGHVPIVLRGVSKSGAPKERLVGIQNGKEMFPNLNLRLFQ